MKDAKFKECLRFVLQWEGGYVDDPDDIGGATNMGITQGTYAQYLINQKKSYKPVKEISKEEVEDIYYNNYYLVIKADKMVLALARVMFDTAVNFGTAGATMFLQEAFKFKKIDGIWKPDMEALLFQNNTLAFARKIVEARIKYRYQRAKEMPSQRKFLQGWLNRDTALMETLASKTMGYEDKVREALSHQIVELAKREMPLPGQDPNMETMGVNMGEKVNQYLASVALKKGSPWCMAFVCFIMQKFMAFYGRESKLPYSGYCPDMHVWAQERDLFVDVPQVGNIVLFYFTDNLPDHIGYVAGVDHLKDGYVTTVEGNTNAEGSSEGNTIAIKERNLDICKFVNWQALIGLKEKSIIYNKEICKGVQIFDSVYVPIRPVGEALGKKIEYVSKGMIEIDGKYFVEEYFNIDGSAWGKLRDLLTGKDFNIEVKTDNSIILTKWRARNAKQL